MPSASWATELRLTITELVNELLTLVATGNALRGYKASWVAFQFEATLQAIRAVVGTATSPPFLRD